MGRPPSQFSFRSSLPFGDVWDRTSLAVIPVVPILPATSPRYVRGHPSPPRLERRRTSAIALIQPAPTWHCAALAPPTARLPPLPRLPIGRLHSQWSSATAGPQAHLPRLPLFLFLILLRCDPGEHPLRVLCSGPGGHATRGRDCDVPGRAEQRDADVKLPEHRIPRHRGFPVHDGSPRQTHSLTICDPCLAGLAKRSAEDILRRHSEASEASNAR